MAQFTVHITVNIADSDRGSLELRQRLMAQFIAQEIKNGYPEFFVSAEYNVNCGANCMDAGLGEGAEGWFQCVTTHAGCHELEVL